MVTGVTATGYKLYRVDKNAESANVEWYYNSILVQQCYKMTADGERYVHKAN